MLQRLAYLVFSVVSCSLLGATAIAATPDLTEFKGTAVQQLQAQNAGAAVSVSPATGTAKFVRLQPGVAVKARSRSVRSMQEKAAAFFGNHAQAFGLRDMSDLRMRRTESDKLGHTHVSFAQEYAGVPVFGAEIKAHFNAKDELMVVSGTLVPDIDLSMTPSRSAKEAEESAEHWVRFSNFGKNVQARSSRLLIFREGLAKGVPGDNHLAYEVEVGNGVDVRKFVYLDAHTGKFIDIIEGVPDALNRRVYDGAFGDFAYVLSIWPGSPFWVEGDAFPSGSQEADNMILASEETYDLFVNAFGRDSFDGAGAAMDSVFNRGYSCPNASWNGAFISFCEGITTDDVTGHEWGHAYTQYTDNLIYQWQPGALNESYSDVIGETVDLLNNRDVVGDNSLRTAGSCSVYDGVPPPTLTITGGSAAGTYFARASVNEPPLPFTLGPLPMVQAEPADACGPITNDVSGQIAIVDWEIDGAPSVCGSSTRAGNAIDAGAAGILFVGPASGLLNLGSNAAIGSVQVSHADGATIKAGLPADATMDFDVGTDMSARWLMGEDSTAEGLVGALRDMATPGCFGNPAKVTDPVYACDPNQNDNGGVHSNSGIPNKAFSLLVDGGSFNGQTIGAIGLTKANHILFRAKTHYQGPATDFAGHADALEQSCSDLVGSNLASLIDGSPSGEIITAADCSQVSSAIAAVELRTPPAQCGFEPLLAQNPPKLCESPHRWTIPFYWDSFEPRSWPWSLFYRAWDTSHEAVTPADFTERDWTIVSDLPDDRHGHAFFGIDPTYGTCAPGGDESAVLHMDSPTIKIPRWTRNLRLTFNHYVATESGWDGGNVKISVNGGPWTVIAPEDFIYNEYNPHFVGWNYIIPAEFGNTNPLAGEFAWSGGDEGSVDGTWGRSIINLENYAERKDKIRLRFDMGTDGCGGTFGWYVDNVTLYQCR